MRFVSALFVLFAASGCDNVYVNCVYAIEAGGMGICFDYMPKEPLDPQQAEEVVNWVEYAAQTYYGRVHNLRGTLGDLGMFVQVTKKDLVVDCHSATHGAEICKDVSGLNHSGHYIIIEGYYETSCIMWTKLAHELLHTVDKLYIDGGEERFNSNTTEEQHSGWMLFIQNYQDDRSAASRTVEHLATNFIISGALAYPKSCQKGR